MYLQYGMVQKYAQHHIARTIRRYQCIVVEMRRVNVICESVGGQTNAGSKALSGVRAAL